MTICPYGGILFELFIICDIRKNNLKLIQKYGISKTIPFDFEWPDNNRNIVVGVILFCLNKN